MGSPVDQTPDDGPSGAELDALHALQRQGQRRELIAQAGSLSDRYPRFVYLINLRGITHAQLSELAEAQHCFERAIAIDPNYADGHNNLGNVLRDLKHPEEAAAAYRRSIALKPEQPQAYYNLGNVLTGLGLDREAIASFRQAITFKPDYVAAHNALGHLLMGLGRSAEAITAFRRTIDLKPDHAEAHNNLANLIRLAGHTEAALVHYRRAVEIQPGNAIAHNNLGNALNALERFDEAALAFRQAIALAPDYLTARSHLMHLYAHVCDWDAVAADAEWIPKIGIEGAAVAPFSMLASEDHLVRHRLRSERLAEARYRRTPLPAQPRPASMPEKLRIGYFSADYHNHATMYLMASLLERHDRERFQIYAYSYGPETDDEMRRRAVAGVDAFRDIRSIGDREAAELARRDGIDIAVDLKGYTQGTRSGIFAYRAAPIQINYLGFPGSMGAPFIDYLIADPVLIPESHRHGYTEQIIYLPHSYQANDDKRVIAPLRAGRSAMGLPEQGFVFACFNNNYKITASAFDIWMRLLGQVEDSVLWLLRANDRVEASLRGQAERRGIDPARIIFAEKLSVPEHIARHAHADLFLDTFNFNAHTTASDALWAGLPIVTRMGDSFGARVAASLLTAVGLPELITASFEDYERLALELATDHERLAAIRVRLWDQRRTAPLFDSALFARHIEEGYVRAFRRYVDGLPPDMIMVEP